PLFSPRARMNYAWACALLALATALMIQVRKAHARQVSSEDASSAVGGGASGTPLYIQKEHLEAAQTAVVSGGAGVDMQLLPNKDEEWLAADATIGSPFQDRLYVVWWDPNAGNPAGGVVRTAFSSNQGTNWIASVTPAPVPSENFVWPSHNTVARNGDVYVA